MDEDFGKRGEALYMLYRDHRNRLIGSSGWKGLKRSCSARFDGGWRRIKALIWKSDVPVVGGAQIV